ncbi:hypothetical protein BDR05DRAFT_1002860 [Suillus weaverae]|nr:hypothetical protein BDR05DRAFT_1002860 [Suillus weaverae]
MQFLCVGDWARANTGALHSELGKVISTNHAFGSVGLDFSIDGCPKTIDVRLQDSERVFWVGDTVRVVAGPYLGLEWYILQMCEDIFHICQVVSKEEVEVSKFYLDHCPLCHTLQPQLPTQQYFEQPLDSESIKIGDMIEVLKGVQRGKWGIVQWFPKGGTHLWFQDTQYTKEKGYDIRPGDIVSVLRGPEYQRKGVVESIDFLNGRLTLISDSDFSLIGVPIRFVKKICNASLDSFKKDIGQEVFIIRGNRKGYQATLYDFAVETCTVAVHGQQHIELKLQDVATRYGMRLNGVMLEGLDITPPVEKVPSSSLVSIANPIPSSNVWSSWSASLNNIDMAHDLVNPISSTSDPWAVDPQDSINNVQENSQGIGSLPWLMTEEFTSTFFTYHVVLKVSLSFLGGSDNGPVPEGCITAFCTSNGAGAQIVHYHIPSKDLNLAPPRKKQQEVLVLDGDHRGHILTVTRCYSGKCVADIRLTATDVVTL